jgi:hypothetical protein
MVLADGANRGPQVRIDPQDTGLPLRRWVTLELLHDCRELQLSVVGEILGRKPAVGEPFQERQEALFEVSSTAGPVPGRVDEIQLLGYDRSDPAELPPALELRGLATPLTYDRYGGTRVSRTPRASPSRTCWPRRSPTTSVRRWLRSRTCWVTSSNGSRLAGARSPAYRPSTMCLTFSGRPPMV